MYVYAGTVLVLMRLIHLHLLKPSSTKSITLEVDRHWSPEYEGGRQMLEYVVGKNPGA